MAEYIDKNATVGILVAMSRNADCECAKKRLEKAAKRVSTIHAADVAPVVHGRWEDSIDEWFGTDVYTCSKCREDYVLVEGTPKENLWHYCPNCGAKMDGGDNYAAD